ncbi:MAG: hypothetical protein JW860_07280 [Sedimentisphaerales bacterium]|nr:hypothetical protein [Sedimentisphaerales bacterium]
MSFIAQVVYWLNVVMNALGRVLLTPLMGLPGWLSNTIISAVMGVVFMVIFKYTSNQKAIGRVRDGIKADMLALKLYKDSMSVTMQSQGSLFVGALKLLYHAIRPMLVMIVPVSLVLAQMALWYQSRPLKVGEEAVLTIKLNGDITWPWPDVHLAPSDSLEVTVQPVRMPSINEISWTIKAREPGYHTIDIQVAQDTFEKELVIGDSFMRVSAMRPDWSWSDMILHPWEIPFKTDSPVQSISITYPERGIVWHGIPGWLIYFFIASLVFALLFKPILKVRI